MAKARIALGVGVLMVAAAIALTLTESPITVARTNTPQQAYIAQTQQEASVCQADETLPARTTAIRLRTFAFLGPRTTVTVLWHGRVIAHGERGSGWTSGVVTVPVNAVPATQAGVVLCFKLFGNGDETVELAGEPTTAALAARTQAGPLPGRLRVEYLRPATASWWSLAPEVARRMGLGHAASGTWSVLVVLTLMAGLLVLCAKRILRDLVCEGIDAKREGRGIPRPSR